MFNHILVAIDFANQPRLIYDYGVEMGNYLGCSIELVNIFHPSQIKGRLRSAKGPGELHRYFEHKMEQLEPKSCGKGSSPPSLLTQKRVINGFPKIELINSSKEPEVDLLILGIRGFSYPFNDEFGDVVTGVSHDAVCPVLLLPMDSQFTGFQKILFLNDNESFDETLIEQVIGFSFLFDAEIHFLYIDHEGLEDQESTKREEFEQLMSGMGASKYSFSYTSQENLLASVNKNIEQNQIKLLHIVSHNRFLWDDFLKLQMKNTYLLNKNIPLIINHLIP